MPLRPKRHTYAVEGSFPLRVTITDRANNTSLTPGGTACLMSAAAINWGDGTTTSDRVTGSAC
jgi:hypothetical protein